MLDFGQIPLDVSLPQSDVAGTAYRSYAKIVFDLIGACILLIPLAVVALCLIVLNPLFNAGPLVFRQSRMGQDCRAFTAYKFRSMAQAQAGRRDAFGALEQDRISRFGHLLRSTRLDELPQIINILRGEMSLIGPRPDSFEHACVYVRHIKGYAGRHRILPGISGYAQTEVGYAEGFDAVQRKVDADLYYMAHASFRLDLWITWRTICVVVGRRGS